MENVPINTISFFLSIIAIIIYLAIWRNFLYSLSKKSIMTWLNLEAKDENMTVKEIVDSNKHSLFSFFLLFFFLLLPSYILFGGIRVLFLGFETAGFSVSYFAVIIFIVYIYYYRILK